MLKSLKKLIFNNIKINFLLILKKSRNNAKKLVINIYLYHILI